MTAISHGFLSGLALFKKIPIRAPRLEGAEVMKAPEERLKEKSIVPSGDSCGFSCRYEGRCGEPLGFAYR